MVCNKLYPVSRCVSGYLGTCSLLGPRWHELFCLTGGGEYQETVCDIGIDPPYITIGRQVKAFIQNGISVQTRAEMIIRIRLPFFHPHFIILFRAYRNKEVYKRSTGTDAPDNTKNDKKEHVAIYHCEFYLGRSNGLSSSVTTNLQKLAVKLFSAGNRMFHDRVNVCVTLRVPNASRLWHVFSIHGKKFSELCLEKMWLNYNASGGKKFYHTMPLASSKLWLPGGEISSS